MSWRWTLSIRPKRAGPSWSDGNSSGRQDTVRLSLAGLTHWDRPTLLRLFDATSFMNQILTRTLGRPMTAD